MVVSDAFLKRAEEEGLRVREYTPPVGGGVECTVTAEDDILVGRLAADLNEAGRLDLCICDERGIEQFRMPDIPFQSGASSVAYQESITFAKAMPTHKMTRVWSPSMKQATSVCSVNIRSTTRAHCPAPVRRLTGSSTSPY
jgi:hypothetical protein